jgi:hypothetical protein
MKHKLYEDGPRTLGEQLSALQSLDVGALKQRWRALYPTWS